LRISPYYLVQECLFDDIDTNLNPKLDACEVGLLGPSEIRTILVHPENLAIHDEQVKEWLAELKVRQPVSEFDYKHINISD